MTQIDINGQFFLTADDPVDHALIRFSLVDGGLTVDAISAYDPNGPNTGNTTLGVTINSWTESVISISTALHQEKFVADVFLYDVTGLAYEITYDLVPDQPASGTPIIENYSYGTYYNDTTQNTWACVDAATAVPIAGIFFYSQYLLTAVGIRVTTTTGEIDFRQDLVPADFYSWDNGFAVLATNALAGRNVIGAVPIDTSYTPIGVMTPLAFEFFVLGGLGAGIVSGGGDDTLRVNLDAAQNETLPESVTVSSCTPNDSVNYFDPLGPYSGSNPVTATILQWDADDIIVQDTQLPSFSPARISVRNATGAGIELHGNPLPQI